MGEERRSCAAAGVTEGARGTQGQAAQVALQGGPGFPGAERNGAETQLRPTRKRDVGAPRRRAAQRNAAEQRESKHGRAGGVKFEPEVVPPEPAETGRPEAEPMRPNGERTHTAKRTGGQSAEAEPARSGRKAGPAGDGRRAAAGAEEGRSRSRLPGRKR